MSRVSAPPGRRARRALALALLLVAGTLAVYWQVRTHAFTNYDDDVYVTDNNVVRHGLTYDGTRWAFTSSEVNWHPLTWLSHMLDCQLHGLDPGAHHLTNVFLHAANTLLLFLVLHRMTAAVWQSAFVAALFAVHPLHVESVAWIAERKDVLSTFFWMLTLWAYVWYTERPSLKRYLLVALALALGLLSKPMLVTLPAVLLLLDYWPLRRLSLFPLLTKGLSINSQPALRDGPKRRGLLRASGNFLFKLSIHPLALRSRRLCGGVSKRCFGENRQSPKEGARGRFAAGAAVHDPQRVAPGLSPSLKSWSGLLWEKLPLFILAAAASAITVIAQRRMGSLGTLDQLPFALRAGNALVSYVRYLGKTIWPAGLAVFYPHPLTALPAWEVCASALLLAGISVAALRGARRRPYLAVGWLWYVGTLVPVIGLVQVGRQAMADRYTYVPLIGVFIIVAWGVPELLAGWRRRTTVLAATAALGLAACSACTWFQLRHWRTSVTLFEHALAVTTDNYIAHTNLGQAFADQGKLADAISQYTAALQIKPDDAATQRNLGAALDQRGMTAEAVAHLSEALRLNPRDAKAHNNMGVALSKSGKLTEAIEQFSAALRLAPNSHKAHSNLGEALTRQGNFPEAIGHLNAAIQLKPDYAEAHNNLGVAFARQGKLADAAAQFSQALRIKADYPEARRNLALALEEQRQGQHQRNRELDSRNTTPQ